MNSKKKKEFRKLLAEELHRHNNNSLAGQDAALEFAFSDDGVHDSLDSSVHDVLEEIALKLGEREAAIVRDIRAALMRLDDGTYGICARCGERIDERRLEVMPTAIYDAACQSLVEVESGSVAGPSL